MRLQFVLGDATHDHSQTLAESVKKILADDPSAQVFYMVPNHLKFNAEVHLLQQLSDDATSAESRLQVLSFSRLAWYFLKNDPVYQQPRLTQTNNTMLIAQLLQDNQDQLTLYRGESQNAGFIVQLGQQLSELTNGRITAEDLAGVKLEATDPHQAKFNDLTTLLAAYQQRIGEFVTTPSLMTALSAKLSTLDLSHTYFFFNHFNELDATELQLVNTMMTRSQAVTFGMVLNKAYTQAPPAAPSLFLETGKLYFQLYQQAQQSQVPVMLDQTAAKRNLTPAMQGINDFWRRNIDFDQVHLPTQVTGIQTAKASDAYHELRTVAIQIAQQVRQGARYRDFLIVARHLDPYQTSIPAIFSELDLPYFLDLEQPMQNHPLVILIDSLFEVNRQYYSYRSVMQLLKTELLLPTDVSVDAFRSALDTTDNYLLKTGKAGRSWFDPKPWRYYPPRMEDELDPEDEPKTQQINQIKQFVQQVIQPIMKQLTAAKTGRDAASALYQGLVSAGVLTQLANWRQQATDRGQLQTAQAQTQVWQTLSQLLDDFVAVFGEQAFSLEQFHQLLDAGFASASYTQIPSTLDQVIISETGLTRLNTAKHIYVIGATSLVMPDQPSENQLLNADDRSILLERLPEDRFLPTVGPDTTLRDPFLNYLAFTAASETLSLSYPINADSELTPSIYFTQLNQAFQLTPSLWQAPTLTTPLSDILGSTRSLISDWLTVARAAKDHNQQLPASWAAVLPALKSSQYGDLATQLAASINYTNDVGKLNAKLATALYGERLMVSVSQLETYFRNHFEYFLKYGLRLQPRPEFILTPADTGSLFHGALDQFISRSDALPDLDATQIQQQVSELIDGMIVQPGYEILTSSARFNFITKQLKALLTQVVIAISQQQTQSDFHPVATELMFGQIGKEHGLTPLIYELPNGRQVQMRGKIDRLDTFKDQDQTYFLVLDYKSSQHTFNDADAYYGQALQMLTYLAAVINDAKVKHQQMRPAGAVYFQLHNPRVKYDRYRGPDVAKNLLKAFQMQGILIETDDLDSPIFYHLDRGVNPEIGGTSDIVRLKFTKSGSLSKSGVDVMSQEDLERYLNNNQNRIIEAALGISEGDIALNPTQYNDEADTITRSDFGAIMQFDPALPTNNYRQLKLLKRQDVLELLKPKKKED